MTGWTTHDIGDLSGRVAVVTGANSGLGLHTARALASHGAEVVLACRNPQRAARAAEQIAGVAIGPRPATVALDLAELASIEACASALSGERDGIDILVNNAGVMALPRMLTADGFEMQLGVNHLGHFALTLRLWPLLAARPGARVVTVSSFMAMIASMHFDDLQGERNYHPWSAYGQSKLANLLFAFELDRRAGAHDDVISVAAHPGYAATELVGNGPRATSSWSDRAFLAAANAVVAQSAPDGALPSLYGATAAGVTGGQYFGPRGPAHLRGRPTVVRGPRAAGKTETARRLWEISEELTGISLPDG